MPRISALSTGTPASTSDIPLNVGSTTVRANVQTILATPLAAQGNLTYADSSVQTTRLASPTSGAVLTYSSGSSIPAWSIPTSGALLAASSNGVPVWRALGTSGQVLQSTGGTPTWVAGTDIAGTIGTTIGSSGQVLQSTGGVATWSAAGTIGTTAGTSGQILQTTAGAATWVNTTAVIAETLTVAGDMLIRSTAGIERLAQPSSGAVLTFSTVDGTSRPLWSIPTSGAVLVASSAGVPTWRAIGTSGQILESSGGAPTWVTRPNVWPLQITGWALTGGTSQVISSNNVVLQFSSAGQPEALTAVGMCDGFAGSTATLNIIWETIDASTGAVVWTLQIYRQASGSTLGAVVDVSVIPTISVASSGILQQTSIGVSFATYNSSDAVAIRFIRQPDNALDTIPAMVQVRSLFFTRT